MVRDERAGERGRGRGRHARTRHLVSRSDPPEGFAREKKSRRWAAIATRSRARARARGGIRREGSLVGLVRSDPSGSERAISRSMTRGGVETGEKPIAAKPPKALSDRFRGSSELRQWSGERCAPWCERRGTPPPRGAAQSRVASAAIPSSRTASSAGRGADCGTNASIRGGGVSESEPEAGRGARARIAKNEPRPWKRKASAIATKSV